MAQTKGLSWDQLEALGFTIITDRNGQKRIDFTKPPEGMRFVPRPTDREYVRLKDGDMRFVTDKHKFSATTTTVEMELVKETEEGIAADRYIAFEKAEAKKEERKHRCRYVNPETGNETYCPDCISCYGDDCPKKKGIQVFKYEFACLEDMAETVRSCTWSDNPVEDEVLNRIMWDEFKRMLRKKVPQLADIIQKTVEGLDTLPTNYATRIETKYKVTNFNNEWHEKSRDSDYDSYRTVIGTDGRAVSTASWTFPITIENGVDSIVFTKGQETVPQNPEKTDIVDGYSQTTSYIIRKQSSNQSQPEVLAQGSGKEIPEGEIERLSVKEKDVIYIEFINTYEPTYKVSLWKTDPNGNVIKTGASFELYQASDFDTASQKPKTNAEAVASGTTGENGILYLEALAEGEYWLIETKAPDGYLLLSSPVKIIVSNNTVTALQGTKNLAVSKSGDLTWVEGQNQDTQQIQIINNPGVELPATGGPGTNPFYLFGIMLTALAAAGFVMKRQRA